MYNINLFFFISVAVPEIVSPMDGTIVTVNQFQPAVFQCSAVGIPPPQFKWMRDRGSQNETLTSSATITITDPVQEDNYQLSDNRGSVFIVNSTLTINEALDGDSGRYFCLASSVPGSDSQEVILVVQGKLSLLDEF